MARRTKEESQRSRERILDAAIEVFHARGVARPSLSDVAQLAGATRGAVYVHFKNKSDVFNALCDRIRLPPEAVTAASDAAPSPDPLGQLRNGWVDFLRTVARDTQMQKILDIIFHRCEQVEENGQILERMQRGRREGMASMAKLIQQAIDRGQLPADLRGDLALSLFHAALAGILSDWLFAPEGLDLEAEAGQIVDALIEMLRSSPSLRARGAKPLG